MSKSSQHRQLPAPIFWIIWLILTIVVTFGSGLVSPFIGFNLIALSAGMDALRGLSANMIGIVSSATIGLIIGVIALYLLRSNLGRSRSKLLLIITPILFSLASAAMSVASFLVGTALYTGALLHGLSGLVMWGFVFLGVLVFPLIWKANVQGH